MIENELKAYKQGLNDAVIACTLVSNAYKEKAKTLGEIRRAQYVASVLTVLASNIALLEPNLIDINDKITIPD